MINRNGEFRMNNYLNAILFGLVGLMGIAVMLGWIFEIPILVQVMIGLAPMQFNNALCFSVIGLAGISYIIRWRWLLLVSGSFGALLSSITLLQYFVKADFGIDFLFMNTHELIPTAHPGSMAPNSAAGHLISFVSLLLLMDNRLLFTRVASWLGATVAALGFVSFAGYLIDMDGGFNWGRYTQMSLHTSFGFILAGSALGVTIIPKRRRIEKSKFLLWPFEIILLAMVFLIDLQIPQGVAVGLLYVMPLLAAWYFKDRRYILLVAVICNLLIVFDIMLATEYVAGKEAVMFNRIMSIVAVWIAAAIFYFLKKLSENQNETELKFKLAVEGTTAGIWDWKDVNQDEEWWSHSFINFLVIQSMRFQLH
ncbi:MAG: hypothetical protein K9G41_10510 [Flavobacteriales bacterium]|nr:hypothetical protein [Flavobacteriales bacterium]